MTTDDVMREVASRYRVPVMNNVHRSEYVEAIVAVALGEPGWRRCEPWNSWDFEHTSGLRMEVKQSAAAQRWSAGRRGPRQPTFDIAARKGFFDRSGRWRSSPGRHAHVYVFAWHREPKARADQREPMSWDFYVVSEPDLPAGQRSIGLKAIQGLVGPVGSCKADRLHETLAPHCRRRATAG